MFTRVAVVGAFTISRLRLLFFDIVRSRSEEERIQSANSKKKKGKNTSLSLSLSRLRLDRLLLRDDTQSGGYLRELVSVREDPKAPWNTPPFFGFFSLLESFSQL